MKVDWKALYNQLGEVKDAYLDPLLEQPDSREEILQKLKDRKLGSEWFQEEKRKLNALKNLVPPEGQEWIGNALTETGKFIDDVWGDVRKFEDPKDLSNLPQNISAVGARGVETFNQGVGLLSEASSFIAHNVLRMDKPVADLGGNVAGFYLTRKLMNKGIGLTNKAIASDTAHNIAFQAGKKVNQLTQGFKPVNQRIVDIKAFDPSRRIVAETSGSLSKKYPGLFGKRKPEPYAFAYDNSQGGSLLKDASQIVPTKKIVPNKVYSERLYDPSTLVNRTKGGAFNTGHQGLANIMYQGIPGWKLKFAKLRDAQQEFSKHHHIEDIAFTGKWANTSDYKEIFGILNTHKIYPGDSPTNIIGMMDEGNKFLQTGKTSLIQELKRTNFPGLENINKYSDLLAGDAPKGLKKIVDTMFKSPEHGDDFFQGSIDQLGRKTPNQMGSMFETLPDGTRVPTVLPQKDIGLDGWRILGLDVPSKKFRQLPVKQQQLLKAQAWANRWKTLGVNRKNIKYDSSKLILSKDHIDTLHYKVYNSPKFTQKRELERMIDDGSYHTLTTEQKAEKIAEVYTIQKIASINVAIRRLEVIKKYIKENVAPAQADLLLRDPYKLREWIKNNNSIAANLGWYPESGKIPDFKTLTNPKTAKITDELRIVFSTLVQ